MALAMTHHSPLSDCRRSLPTIHYPLATLLLLALVGCGTGEYERRLNNRLNQMRKESKFKDLYDWLQLPDMPAVSVRLPLLFKDPPLVEGAQVDGKVVDLRRVRPEWLILPGLMLTYEGFVDAAEGKVSYYCYVGAMETHGVEVLDPKSRILREGLDGQQHEALTDWTDFQAQTPVGQTVSWKKLRFVGPQEFFTVDKRGREQFKTMPGVLEIYLHQENGYLIAIAWRMPTSIEQQVDLSKVAAAVAGCARVKK